MNKHRKLMMLLPKNLHPRISRKKPLKGVQLTRVGENICSNKDCKRRIIGKYKVLVAEGTNEEFALCLRCYSIYLRAGIR